MMRRKEMVGVRHDRGHKERNMRMLVRNKKESSEGLQELDGGKNIWRESTIKGLGDYSYGCKCLRYDDRSNYKMSHFKK